MSEAKPPDTPPLLTEGDRKFLKTLVAPDTPPLLEEGDLNPAETKVLNAFRGGWESGEGQVIVHPGVIGISSVEELAKRLKPDATLRASFLRSLFLGSYDRLSHRSIMISCAWIEGRLDLDYCELSFPFGFSECIFSKGISLRAATISELGLVKCFLYHDKYGSSLSSTQVRVITNVSLNNQFTAYGEVDLNSAIIGGQLDCTDGHFKKGLTAQSLKTGGDAFLRKDFECNDVVELSGASIGGQIACDGGHFKNGLIAQSLKTGNDVIMSDGFESNGLVDLINADIGGNLNCISGRFEKGLSAVNLKTGISVFLMRGFISAAIVNLNSAEIGGQLVCDSGYFNRGLVAQGSNTGGSVFLTEGFKSNGEVDMIGAEIGGQFICTGGHFEKGLRIQNSNTGGSVFLTDGFKSNGEVNLGGMDIGGQLNCAGGRFGEGLKAQSLKASSDVFLRGNFESNGMVDLLSADIGGQLDCADTSFSNGLIADGLRYRSIYLGSEWNDVLAWLHQIRGDGFQPYEQLVKVYRRMGHADWAREIGFELEKKRHKRYKGLWRAWYSILKWTIGYGYKPFRFVGLAFILFLIGAILFNPCPQMFSSKFTSSGCRPAYLANEWIPSEGRALDHWREKGQAPQGYPEFNPVIYSLEAIFPVLPLGQLDKWHPDNTLFRWVRWTWTLTGSLLLPILALFGMVVLRPNWQNEKDSS